MKYRVRHTTAYQYGAAVNQCYNLAYVIPRHTSTQKVIRSDIKVSPTPSMLNKRDDYFGNTVCNFSLEKPHKDLEVTVESFIEKEDTPSLWLDMGVSCQQVLERLKNSSEINDIAACEFLFQSPMIPHSEELADFARDLFIADRPLLAAVTELNSRIFEEFHYDPSFSTVATPLSDVLEHKRGVCQDFAHLAIACMRSLGYPARYVSGYLETLPPPGQVKLEGADASHAWFSAYAPGEGWLDFDPTNNCMPGEQHITTAWGRDYADVTPLKGVLFGGGSSSIMEVSVDVQRVETDS